MERWHPLRDTIIPPLAFSSKSDKSSGDKRIGILGAGAGGLYVAMILQDLGIPYEIIEARERVGGRLFSYKFKNSQGAPYNYFDVGAMRFPQTDSMNRVWHLFGSDALNKGLDIPFKSRIKPFYFTGAQNNNTYRMFNGQRVLQCRAPPNSEDAFKAREVIQDVDGDEVKQYIDVGGAAIVDNAISEYAESLLDDLKVDNTGQAKSTGWDKLMAVDDYSTRAFLAFKYRPTGDLKGKIPDKPLSADLIGWVETVGGGTGWYDRAFSETVLEAIAFGFNPNPNTPPTPWYCIDGGAVQIAEYMHSYLEKQRPGVTFFNERVTAISMGSQLNGTIEVQSTNMTDGRTTPRTYDHVISTIPLPVLRTLDLRGAGLSTMQLNALRQLDYGPSVKIGMLFKSAWWTTGTNKDGMPLNIVGGQTYTDSPLRTVVYPSFGDSLGGNTTSLIASYCWTEDAMRLGAMIDNGGQVDQLLEDMVLRELETIHDLKEGYLKPLLLETKGWSWSHDPYTMGAFAFFGPGKFKNLYNSLNKPAGNNHLHFAGEALSPRHAWVEGALDSAWRAVSEFLAVDGTPDQRAQFEARWGVNPEWVRATVPRSSHSGVPESVLFAPEGLLSNHMWGHIASPTDGIVV